MEAKKIVYVWLKDSSLTPLHRSVIDGDIEGISRYVGGDIHKKGPYGWTPLHLAAGLGNFEAVKILTEKGSNVNEKDDHGDTPLHFAAWTCNRDILNYLRERGGDAEAKDCLGRTPLEREEEYNRTDMYGNVSHYYNPDPGKTAEIKRLLMTGGDVNWKDEKSGNTPLHMASERGNIDGARLIVENGGNVDPLDNRDMTPLLKSLSYKHPEFALFMINQGANINARNSNGVTPLHIAAERGFVKVIDLLFEKGADIGAKNEDGLTALHRACLTQQIEAIRVILDRGVEVNMRDNFNKTPLHWATSGADDNKVIEFLISRGADLNLQDDDGMTPLHTAIQMKKEGAAKFLLQKGANPDIKTSKGKSCMDMAQDKGQKKLVKIIAPYSKQKKKSFLQTLMGK